MNVTSVDSCIVSSLLETVELLQTNEIDVLNAVSILCQISNVRVLLCNLTLLITFIGYIDNGSKYSCDIQLTHD